MKFVCEGLLLSDAAVIVSKACSAKTLNPILECIRLSAANDVLTMTAYDGEISIEKKIKAEVLDEGEVCVNGKFFADFICKISDENIIIGECDKGIKIEYGDNETCMQVLNADEFPRIGGDKGEEFFTIQEKQLKDLIAKCVFCCATDESRPILKGCLLECYDNQLHATALDGFRMAVTSAPLCGGSGNMKIVCPARTLSEISRMLDGGDKEVSLYVSKNMLSLEIDDTVLTSKLYVGEFVRKENIYPAEFATQVLLSRKEMIESVERASVVIRGDKNNLILLDVKNGSVVITANSEMGNVAESVGAQLEGRELKIAMNGKYLMDALKALEEEKIYISFNSSVSPFVAENEQDKTASYLILPVRTSNTAANN